jgi:hypothetical protein
VTPTATLEIRLDGQVVKAGDVRNLPVGVYLLLYTATRRDQQISRSTSITGVWGLTSRFRSHMSRRPLTTRPVVGPQSDSGTLAF